VGSAERIPTGGLNRSGTCQDREAVQSSHSTTNARISLKNPDQTLGSCCRPVSAASPSIG
ncbi:MAG TPA: hypothetical protein VES40_16680, partial [Ilumatobacteraceae bacterium]|nr:hypothetical protein [Ilumatobacteraceae bacterium]